MASLLQVPMAFLTSFFIGIFDEVIVAPESVVLRIILLVPAIVLTGIGASLTVGMKFVPNPADGLANAIGKSVGKDLGLGKNILDAICIVISLVLGWVFTRSLLGIGIGTVLAVIFTGRVMALVQKTTERIYRWCMGEQVGSAH